MSMTSTIIHQCPLINWKYIIQCKCDWRHKNHKMQQYLCMRLFVDNLKQPTNKQKYHQTLFIHKSLWATASPVHACLKSYGSNKQKHSTDNCLQVVFLWNIQGIRTRVWTWLTCWTKSSPGVNKSRYSVCVRHVPATRRHNGHQHKRKTHQRLKYSSTSGRCSLPSSHIISTAAEVRKTLSTGSSRGCEDSDLRKEWVVVIGVVKRLS